MDLQGWIVFALFWAVFVTTPGPNAVNCITTGMAVGFARALPAVAGILTQACLFLALSAAGITTLLTTAPAAFTIAKLVGAVFLIWTGVRGWLRAADPAPSGTGSGGSIYRRAFAIATINPKSVAGYLAAFTQFIQPGVPIMAQMTVIVPTALTLTALSYTGYTALGAGLGRAALGAVFNVWFRRALAVCFIIYGVLLGIAPAPG